MRAPIPSGAAPEGHKSKSRKHHSPGRPRRRVINIKAGPAVMFQNTIHSICPGLKGLLAQSLSWAHSFKKHFLSTAFCFPISWGSGGGVGGLWGRCWVSYWDLCKQTNVTGVEEVKGETPVPQGKHRRPSGHIPWVGRHNNGPQTW